MSYVHSFSNLNVKVMQCIYFIICRFLFYAFDEILIIDAFDEILINVALEYFHMYGRM